jgi:HSP20 family protein
MSNLIRWLDSSPLWTWVNVNSYSPNTYVEREKDYLIEVELPRFSKKDVKVSVENDTVVIQAEKKDNKYSSSFYQSYYFDNVDVDNISAELKDGVLSVILPKKQVNKPAPKQIEIK